MNSGAAEATDKSPYNLENQLRFNSPELHHKGLWQTLISYGSILYRLLSIFMAKLASWLHNPGRILSKI